MDMQMPVMDGLDATRAIRELPNGKTVPIIAMTANAFDEDRKRCIEAGMDDHLAKPLNLKRLDEILARLLSGEPTMPEASPEPADPAVPGGLPSFESVAHLFNGNRVLYAKVLHHFQNDHRHDIAKLKAAWNAGDRELAIRLAHTLKGASATLGASSLSTAAKTLEVEVRNGNDFTSLTVQLQRELEAVLASIDSMIVRS